ncbi:putative fumarate hydratase, class II [Opisthorchis viverrini]|uniref:fumarate hydratase n=2 Tax=Opisthorchis viverrini TaxID=6198 RepID=A0A075ACZ8_OPIVI|nr:hypothetical protein T265_06847 [Opisthorchis viverrini]KER25744.1 hypothetical protein T265_06847 [Opisthorchis viverrini]OON20812.1 putative fumarate hydratase, class II [Opisthorchis viverrini]
MTEGKGDPCRVVEDSFGAIEVPLDSYYGAQTERSRRNFNICLPQDKIPLSVVYALAMLKEIAAGINCAKSRISSDEATAIIGACREVYSGKLDDQFPLSIWQTGSGTQTNMNVNEVVANRATELLCGSRTGQPRIHPNDHVNCGQSSNDIFPTAMNLSVSLETAWNTIPALESLVDAINAKASQFRDVVKIGRTHLQDAVPMTFGQELGSFGARLSNTIGLIRQGVKSICNLAVGGTAVGTGLNSTKGFDLEMCDGVTKLVEETLRQRYGDTANKYMKLTFTPAENKFAALAGHDDLLQLSSCFNQTATILFKLAGDFALLSSGPSCGLGELILPPNEPGSSIMPGKVNPTQCEALRMVSLQVMGNHFTTSMAASLGQLQLNVFKPLIVAKMLHSCRLLRDAAISFTRNCVEGLQINHRRVEEHVRNSLMLVTALTPHIGYDKAARLAKYAKENSLTLREAALKLDMVSAEEFDRVVRPASMAFPFSEENMNNN